MIPKPSRPSPGLAAAALVMLAAGGAAWAQEKSAATSGRYAMSPADGGFARLDTETGAMSMCKSKGPEWACAPMSDASADLKGEAAKLAAENKELRAEVKRLEELIGLGDKKDGTEEKRTERPGLTLPSEADIDKALSYLERMVKKFQDRIKQFEGGHGDRGKGTPL